MNYQEVVDLIDKLDQSSVRYLHHQTQDVNLVLSKDPVSNQVEGASPILDAPASQATEKSQAETQSATPAPSVSAEETPSETQAIEGDQVVAPIVGVVYLQPDPDSEPFIQVGDEVKEGDVLVIVEAMKIMNEIRAPRAGKIAQIYVDNESVVEFNQPLVLIQ